ILSKWQNGRVECLKYRLLAVYRHYSMLPGKIATYKSIDTVIDQDEAINYATEFLNSLHLSGLLPHIINVKVSVPIILLRNIDPPRLCTGTGLAVKGLLKNSIETIILIGKFKG
ncbi:hypothetical protein AVEN_259057-1, partial [Araneus ventricosus]